MKIRPKPFVKRILRVQMNHNNAGFFVYLEFVINAIIYCQSHRDYCSIPEVDYGERNLRGRNRYYEAKHGNNMFEYYFYLKKKNHWFHRFISKRTKKSVKFWWGIHRNIGIQCYPHDKHKSLKRHYDKTYCDEVKQWYAHNRVRAHSIIKEHICISREVLDLVDRSWNIYFRSDDYVVGVQVRGTDKQSRIGGRKIHPEEYYPYIDQLIDRHNAKLFLATDDQQHCDLLHKRYGKRLFSNPVLRHEKNIFLVDKESPFRKGLEVLVDCLMLSKCNFLLKCSSAVSEFAIFFNNNLHENSLDLQFDCSAFLTDSNTPAQLTGDHFPKIC